MKKKSINLEQILLRKHKGFAFRRYPVDGFNDASEYIAAMRIELQEDYKKLSEDEFRAKYEMYIY